MKTVYHLTAGDMEMWLNGPLDIYYIADGTTAIHFDGMSADGMIQSIITAETHLRVISSGPFDNNPVLRSLLR